MATRPSGVHAAAGQGPRSCFEFPSALFDTHKSFTITGRG